MLQGNSATRPAATGRRRSRIGVLAALTASHATNDLYISFLTPLLPLLISRFGLTLTLAGLLQSVLLFSGSVAQPVFGHLTDRSGRLPFIALGPLLTAIAMGSLGLLNSYPAVVAALVVAGLSSALVHPQASSVIPQVAGTRRGAAMGTFIAGGTFGYAVGPLLLSGVVAGFGLRYTYYTICLAVLVFPLLWRGAPRTLHATGLTKQSSLVEAGSPQELSANARPLILLLLVVICRSAAFNGFATFMPVLLEREGFAMVQYAGILSLFVGAGAVGTLFGGYLVDALRDARGAMALLFSSSFVCLAAAVYTRGWSLWVLTALTGGLLEAANPIAVVLAHETVPANRALASGLTMGLGWGLGALLLTPLGALGDELGLPFALLGSALALVLGVPIARALPPRNRA